jgi:hypothetical protein
VRVSRNLKWCVTHGERAHDAGTLAGALYECNVGRDQIEDCQVVKATLIFEPPHQERSGDGA